MAGTGLQAAYILRACPSKMSPSDLCSFIHQAQASLNRQALGDFPQEFTEFTFLKYVPI